MEFRRATFGDIELIRELGDIIFHYTYKEIISQEQMDYMFEWMYSLESLSGQMESGHIFFVAYKKAEPCGFFSVELKDDIEQIYHLQKLYLLPSYHGCGAGRELLRGVFDYIKGVSGKHSSMHLNVNRDNKRAIRFYEKSGLIKIKSKDICIGRDFYMKDYIMAIEFEGL